MHPPPLPTVVTDGLTVSMGILAVLFLLFPVIAYAYAAIKQRKLLWTWRDLREALAPAHVYRARTVRFDMAMFAAQLFLVLPAVTYVGALYTAQQFAGFLHAHVGPPPLSISNLVIAALIQLAASEILGSFGTYIFHYAGHKVPMFWALHQVHHSTEALSPFTAVRGHPIDTLLGVVVGSAWKTLVVGVALYFTGGGYTPAALSVISVMAVASLMQAALNHAHVPLCYGWLNRFWVGPSFHHIHHSAELRHRDKNLGGGIPVWDWVFGTFYMPRPGEAFTLGLNHQSLGDANPHNSFDGYMIAPMANACREFGKLIGLGPKQQRRRSFRPAAFADRSGLDQKATQAPLR